MEKNIQNAFIVQPVFVDKNLDYSYKLEEAINLAESLDLNISGSYYNKIKDVNPSLFMSKGFTESLIDFIIAYNVDIVFINSTISAVQQRNLENKLNVKVVDRNGIILSIFEKRAKSKEGKLQASLASLTYQKSRIVKAWSHLERQRGGGGFIGGPGETQKELDRRIITEKISSLEKQLKKVKLNRTIQSNSRKKNNIKTVVLVGYTNAGKSTLFNTITNEKVFAKDLLFATLDPTTRILDLPNKQKILMVDTVGFISDLPHNLVEAFHSTLEGIKDADIILHVIDASNQAYEEQKEDVIKVLAEIGIDELTYLNKTIEVYNKIDLLSEEQLLFFQTKASEEDHIFISAHKNINLNLLVNKVYEKSNENLLHITTNINYKDNDLVLEIYKKFTVISKITFENEVKIDFLATLGELNFLKENYNSQFFSIKTI